MVDREYKILGELSGASKVGVLGRNTATTGSPIGVAGTVGSATGFGLYTDDDAYVGTELDAGSVATEALSVGDGSGSTVATANASGTVLTIDFTSSGQSEHALELVDRVANNTEQLSIKGDADGSSEVVFRDVQESNYKWGLRASSTNDFFIDNHANLTSRVQFVQQGPTRLLGQKTVLEGTSSGVAVDIRGDVDANGNRILDAGKHVASVSSDTTLETRTDDLVVADTSGSDLTLTLPAGPPEGASFTIKKSSGSNTLVVDPNGAAIDGQASTVSLAADTESIVVTADGNGDWWIEARYGGSL